MLVATGILVSQAIRTADRLAKMGIMAAVVDLYRIKPLNDKRLCRVLAQNRRVATMEENTIVGGLGSAICEMVAENGLETRVKRFGLQDTYRCEIGDRENLRARDGIDLVGITDAIGKWLNNTIDGEAGIALESFDRSRSERQPLSDEDSK